MDQLYQAMAKLGEVCFTWFLLLRLANKEQAKNVMTAVSGSGSVQTGFYCIPHFMRISNTIDDALYLRGTEWSDHTHSLSFLSIQSIRVLIMVKSKRVRIRVISSVDRLCSHG